jgi:hypothetical protein
MDSVPITSSSEYNPFVNDATLKRGTRMALEYLDVDASKFLTDIHLDSQARKYK